MAPEAGVARVRHVAFLRAVNVAGHAIVKMADLKDAFERAGCKDVKTFVQSGNVVFESSVKGAPAMFRRLPVTLRDLLGVEPTILFRTIGELDRLVKADPFTGFDVPPDAKRYVTFLSRPPERVARLPLVSPKEALEAVTIQDLDVFIVSRRKKNGFYGFPNNFVEKELGVAATTRNWSTVAKIVEFAGMLV